MTGFHAQGEKGSWEHVSGVVYGVTVETLKDDCIKSIADCADALSTITDQPTIFSVCSSEIALHEIMV